MIMIVVLVGLLCIMADIICELEENGQDIDE